MWSKHEHAQSQFWVVKTGLSYYSFRLYTRTALAWTKKKPIKRSLRNEKLKPNRASETEEQMKERLRIRCEKDRAGRRNKNYKRKRIIRNKTTKNSAWPLSKD